jgi:Family of unknown function (DUF5996)
MANQEIIYFMNKSMHNDSVWMDLPYPLWKDTCETLHRWIQIVGKIRLSLTPWMIHSWHATFYVTPRGLSTSLIQYGERSLEIEFDFLEHKLIIRTDTGEEQRLPLKAQSVASFYRDVFQTLDALGIQLTIHGRPNELTDTIPFDQDEGHASYDPLYAYRFWRILLETDRIFKLFRTGFLGKSSPVHLFWGSFDLAVTRFSGRPAPRHPGGVPNLPDIVTREAYSHEVSSAGFWPGGGPVDYAAYYSYTYPMPPGFSESMVQPKEAFFSKEAGEFLLPYEAVRTSADPKGTLIKFLQTTYEAAADCAHWDRVALECAIGQSGIPRIV